MSQAVNSAELQAEADLFQAEFQTVRDAVGQVIVGQDEVVEALSAHHTSDAGRLVLSHP